MCFVAIAFDILSAHNMAILAGSAMMPSEVFSAITKQTGLCRWCKSFWVLAKFAFLVQQFPLWAGRNMMQSEREYRQSK